MAPGAGIPIGRGGGEEPYVDTGPTTGPPEALVLDIGDGVGALLLFASEACLGREIDLTPAGTARSHHLHSMVRRRRGPDREHIVAVYPEVRAGTYTVWGLDDRPLGDVEITGGQVSEFAGGDCGATPPGVA